MIGRIAILAINSEQNPQGVYESLCVVATCEIKKVKNICIWGQLCWQAHNYCITVYNFTSYNYSPIVTSSRTFIQKAGP